MACSNCSSNTLYVNPANSSCGITEGCGQGLAKKNDSLFDPVSFCTPGKLGPRKSREKVREKLKDFTLLRLGAPVVRIELDEQQLDAAVDYAMKIFEDYAPREYFNFYVFNTTPGKSIYQMPPDIGLIRNVFYKEQPGLFFNASDLGGVLPIEYYYPGGGYASSQGGLMDPNQPIYGRAGEWTNYMGYQQLYSRLSSQIGGWEWLDGYCTIKLYPTPCRCASVIVHYLQKKYDFKEVTQALAEGTYAYAMQMLGRIRGKYTNIPGPQGGVQLDGPQLLAEAKELITQWTNDLITRYSDLPVIFMD